MSPSTAELPAIGATVQLTAEVRDPRGQPLAGATVTWVSGAPSVATVGSTGLVTAAGNGTATITATAGAASGSASMTVAQVVDSVVVTPAVDTLVASDTLRLAAQAFDSNGHRFEDAAFSWASSDAAVARVDATGLVTGVGAGAVVIQAVSDGVSGRAELIVTPRGPAAGFTTARAAAGEGERVFLAIALDPPPDAAVALTYTIGPDRDAGSADADTADYADPRGGRVEIGAGRTGATIEIAITDDDEIEPVREIFVIQLDQPAGETGYTLGRQSHATVTIEEGVCDRTQIVRKGIMDHSGATLCSGPDEADLAAITQLDFCPASYDACGTTGGLASLREGDFAGLASLQELQVRGYGGLTRLPARVFAGLSSLRELNVQNNGLAELPAGLFSGLTNLEWLFLPGNRIRSLPPNVFLGLSKLRHVSLNRNPGTPFPLVVEIVRTDSQDLHAPGPARVAVRIAEGAPFTTRLPLSVLGGTLSAETAVIEAGRASSDDITLSRGEDGAAGALVAVGSVPALPGSFGGIVLEAAEPVAMFRPTVPVARLGAWSAAAAEGDTATVVVSLSAPLTSTVTLDYSIGPDDDGTTPRADGSDHAGGSGGTIEIAAGTTRALIRVPINDDDEIEPPQESFLIELTEPGGDSPYAIGYPNFTTVTIEEGVCDRTRQVAREIMRTTGATGCSQISEADLANITALNLHPGGTGTTDVRAEREPYLAPCRTRGRAAADPVVRFDWGPGACGPGATTEDVAGTGRSVVTSDAITALRQRDFSGLTGLRRLDLSRNRIGELPDGAFADLSSLTFLSLEGNPLTELDPGDFAGLSRLSRLNLRSTRLTGLPSRVFSDLANLRQLYLHDGGQIAELAPDAFAGLASLELLWLNNNRLTELPPEVFADLTSLKELWIWWNHLADLPPGVFSDLSNLESLFVNTNRLTELPDGVFSGLTRLTHLGVHDNEIAELPSDIFAGLGELVELVLVENRLSRLPARSFADLPNLELLALEGNRLTALPEGAFDGLGSLQELYLGFNRLADLPDDVFSDLASLESLNLAFNWLQDLRAGIFVGLARMQSLSLTGNPGAPFTLTLNASRTDNGNALAPGPANVSLTLEEGAPFGMTIPLSVHGGELSAGALTLVAGSDRSSEVTVSRSAGNQAGTQVVPGPAPALPSTVRGVQLAISDPLVLFGTVSNRAPVAEHAMPWLGLRAGGDAAVVDVASYFRDPDGDDLAYSATSGSPEVISARVAGRRVTIDPVGAGSATVTVMATDPGGLSTPSSLRVGVRGSSPGSYDIDLFLVDEVSESIQAAFDDAVDYWSSILADTELPDVPVAQDLLPLGCWDIITERTVPTIDDLLIVASVRKIDGPFGVLASAGPCGIREGLGGLPFIGAMQFDVDDLERLDAEGDMEEVVLHEMGHILGIGTIWDRFGLLVNPSLPDNSGVDTHFPGPLTIAAFDEAGGTTYTGGQKVPIENRAGPGSGDSPWRESVLAHELMTPAQNGGVPDPLSAITIQSLADMGYTVDVGVAEPYRLPGTAAAAADPARKIEYGDDILRGPIVVVDRNGRIVRVIPN
ncbi:MAG: leucine-rich repeat protein [Gemmatimonadales bacterium]|nr:leucine-rich repeat protein [Gemmatimonadales bacterium]